MRWTLRVTVKALPWQPTPCFSGVSIYTLAPDGEVSKQEDYWDSVNLREGRWAVGLAESLGVFLGQLQQDKTADMVVPEMSYELLWRGKEYEVWRYPAHVVAETVYYQRPEGYDLIGNYVRGLNAQDRRILYFSPTVMAGRYPARAVVRFEVPVTEVVARGFTSNLIKFVTADGMRPTASAYDGMCHIGQYEALFSLNKRRNEAWIELEEHPWME